MDKKQKSLHKLRRADILLAAVPIVCALALLAFLHCTRTDGAVAVVTVEGRETARYALDRDTETEIEGVGGTNHLVITNGTVGMTNADCPDKLCVKQGSIRYDGESIVCLPHKVVVTIESEEKPDVDAYSG